MRLTRLPLVAVVAGAAVLAGCSSSQTTTTTAPVPPPAATSTSDAPAATPAPTSGSSPTSAEASPGQEGRCTIDQVTATVGRTTGEAGQRHTIVVWTNSSGSGCRMDGFGGVDLKGPEDPMGDTYSLPRSSEAAESFTLAPGEAAHTTITWLPPQDGGNWTPTTMLVTPPNETRSATLDWPGGAVLRQDGATRPGTYIGPVLPGAEG